MFVGVLPAESVTATVAGGLNSAEGLLRPMEIVFALTAVTEMLAVLGLAT